MTAGRSRCPHTSELFFGGLRRASLRHLTELVRPRLLTECAHLLAALEERCCSATKLCERAPPVDRLRSDAPLDAEELRALLAGSTKRSVRHLVRGLEARCLTQDVEAAVEAITESAARFSSPLGWRNALRFESLRLAVPLLRGRSWARIVFAATNEEPPAFARQPA
jgi:hypothetical protein